MMGLTQQKGFTLVELIVVVIITAVLSGVMVQFITTPVESYTDVSRRARLTDIAETAMQRLRYEIKTALPNSIRVGCNGNCVEFLRTVTGGRYRLNPGEYDPGPPAVLDDDVLSFNENDPPGGDLTFSVLGPFDPGGLAGGVGSNNDCQLNNAYCVVVYNTGLNGSNAWNMDNMATLTGVTVTSASPPLPEIITIAFDNDNFSATTNAEAFPAESPQQRFYIVDDPVKFVCGSSGDLLRFEGYTITRNRLTDPDLEIADLRSQNVAESVLADQVTDCSFSYQAGATQRNAILNISLTITEAGEDITLLQQLHVVNLP